MGGKTDRVYLVEDSRLPVLYFLHFSLIFIVTVSVVSTVTTLFSIFVYKGLY